MKSFDVLIVGAGIIGSACACECSQAGLRVGIVEGNIPAGGATGAAMGHVVVMDDSPSQLALTQYSRSLWRDLRSQLPATVEYENPGTIWLAADEEEMEEVRHKQKNYLSADVNSIILDADTLASAEPQLRPGLTGGLLVPDDAIISPAAAAQYFLTEATRRGAVLLRGHTAVSAAAGIVRLNDGSALNSERIAVATGADTTVVPWLSMQKRKGHLLLTDSYPNFLHHQLVELAYVKSAHQQTQDSVAFNIQPRYHGQLLIGSSRQYGDESASINNAILDQMTKRAYSYMPALAQLSVLRTWTGFRAATPDKLPLIGPTPDPTVFLAMGFEGLGITSAPAAARLLVDHLLGRESKINPAPYLPSRILSSKEHSPSHKVVTRQEKL